MYLKSMIHTAGRHSAIPQLGCVSPCVSECPSYSCIHVAFGMRGSFSNHMQPSLKQACTAASLVHGLRQPYALLADSLPMPLKPSIDHSCSLVRRQSANVPYRGLSERRDLER